jgi:hypothetical protein
LRRTYKLEKQNHLKYPCGVLFRRWYQGRQSSRTTFFWKILFGFQTLEPTATIHYRVVLNEVHRRGTSNS